MKRKVLRYIKNNYDIKSIDINNSLNTILGQIEIAEKNSSVNYPPNMTKSIDSQGKRKTKTTFYTGKGGNIYIYWKQYLFHDKKKEYLENFHQALKKQIYILWKKIMNMKKIRQIHFLWEIVEYIYFN